MAEIWIVSGSTGQYEDYTCWDVCAFSTKELAQDLVDSLNHRALELGVQSSQCRCDYHSREQCVVYMRALDPTIPHIDYNGVDYGCHPLTLVT